MIKKTILSAITILVFAAAVSVGFVFSKGKPPGGGAPADPADPAISYIMSRFTRNWGRLNDLYVMNADGSRQTLLLEGKKGPQGSGPWGYWKPSWSPDARQLVVEVKDPDNNCIMPDGSSGSKAQLQILDVEVVNDVPKVTGARTLTDCNHEGGDPGRDSVWSPDGSRIAFVANGTSIYTINPLGPVNASVLKYTETADEASWVKSLTWNPGSQKLAYILRHTPPAGYPDTYSIRLLDLSTGEASTLIPRGYRPFLYGLDWSRQGDWIAYSTNERETYGIYKFLPAAVNPTDTIELVDRIAIVSRVSWSPDDGAIIHDAGDDSRSYIRSVPANGGEGTVLAEGGQNRQLTMPDRRRF